MALPGPTLQPRRPEDGSAVRTLAIAVAVLGVVAIGGGQALEATATQRVRAQLASSTAAVEGVDVDLAGFPVAFRAATGRVPGAVIEVRELTTREPEVTFSPVVLDLRRLRFDPLDLALGRTGSVDVGEGSATATLPAAELTRLAAEHGPGWDIRLDRDRLVASGQVQDVEVRVVVAVEVVDDALHLNAREVAVGDGEVSAAAIANEFDRSVTLPELPGRVRLTDAEVGPDGVVLRGEIRGTLDLGT